MGKHVNHYDVQDKIITRNSIINKHSGSLSEKDPATLSIAEQEKLMAERLAEKRKKQEQIIKPIPKPRFTGAKLK